ncbi:unnamed protein product [Lactuca saligna]|uniref:Uncharacterized protein n=1 Tax=Lactuca saligna TaxID=75948 RepID=A0AA36A2P7_LACSI|nr:unnamed protein product [Lactuca saligna]
MVSFDDLQFNPKEEKLPNELIMSSKEYKILNSKLNYLLQIKSDTGGNNYYKDLHGKVYFYSGVITRLVEFNTEYTKQFEDKSEKDAKVFEKLEEFVSGIKETLSKVYLSNQSHLLRISLINGFEHRVKH